MNQAEVKDKNYPLLEKNLGHIENISQENPDEPFHLFDLSVLRKTYHNLVDNLPNFSCHYAMKACSLLPAARVLYQEGSNIDIASKGELVKWLTAAKLENPTMDTKTVIEQASAKAIFSNPNAKDSDVAFALSMGVKKLVVDSASQLNRIYHAAKKTNTDLSEIELVVRLAMEEDKTSFQALGSDKFGINTQDAINLMQRSKALGFEKFGMSFHVGFQTTDNLAWKKAFDTVENTIALCKDINVNISTVDIGGGIPVDAIGHDGNNEKIYQTIKEGYKRINNLGVENFIFEPGNSMMSASGLTIGHLVNVNGATPSGKVDYRVITDIGNFNSGLVDHLRKVYLLDDNTLIPLYGDSHSEYSDKVIYMADTSCDTAGTIGKNKKITSEADNFLKNLLETTKHNVHEDIEKTKICLTGTGAYFGYETIDFNSIKALPVYVSDGEKIVMKYDTPQSRLEQEAEKAILSFNNSRSSIKGDMVQSLNHWTNVINTSGERNHFSGGYNDNTQERRTAFPGYLKYNKSSRAM